MANPNPSYTFKITPELKDRLKLQAQKEQRSQSSLIRFLLSNYFQEKDKQVEAS